MPLLPTFAECCVAIFLAAQKPIDPRQNSGGVWEARATSALEALGILVAHGPRLDTFGLVGASGLGHQIDASFRCRDAFVLAEWKARPASGVGKAELLSFKAASDDVAAAVVAGGCNLPVMRMFGGPVRIPRRLRRYAAATGIAAIDVEVWPSPVLASDEIGWAELGGPTVQERRLLSQLTFPVGSPPVDASLGALTSRLDLQDEWSATLWEFIDAGRVRRLPSPIPVG
jgi:hypothetical protein